MREKILEFLTTVLSSLLIAAITALLIMWRDLAIAKRDIDALAEIIGTKRAKCRKNRRENL